MECNRQPYHQLLPAQELLLFDSCKVTLIGSVCLLVFLSHRSRLDWLCLMFVFRPIAIMHVTTSRTSRGPGCGRLLCRERDLSCTGLSSLLKGCGFLTSSKYLALLLWWWPDFRGWQPLLARWGTSSGGYLASTHLGLRKRSAVEATINIFIMGIRTIYIFASAQCE